MKRLGDFLRDETGASAAEFAMVVPVVLILIFGAIASGVMAYTWMKLQHAIEDTARCYSAQRTDCAQDATEFASKYPGLILDGLVFDKPVYSADAECTGYKARAGGTFNFLMGQGVLSTDIYAQACYPGFDDS